MPVDVEQRARKAAAGRGLNVTALLRRQVESGLTDLETDATVSRANAMRALLGLHPIPPAA